MKVHITDMPQRNVIYAENATTESPATSDVAARLIKPWMILNRCFGIWDVSSGSKQNIVRKISFGFKVVLTLLSWACVVTSARKIYIYFDKGDSTMLDHAKFIFGLVYSSSAGWILTSGILHRHRHAAVALRYTDLVRTLSLPSLLHLRKVSHAFLAVFIPICLIPSTGMLIIFTQMSYESDFGYRNQPAIMVSFVLLSGVMQCVILYFVFAYCLVCLTLAQRVHELYQGLAELRRELLRAAATAENSAIRRITDTFREFENICELISSWNDSISSIILMMFLFGTLQLLTNIYTLLFDDDLCDRIAYGLMIGIVLFIFIALILSPDILKRKISMFCCIVNSISISASEELVRSDGVSLLVRLVNCSQIEQHSGCTMCNCFSLERGQILAVFSFVLTYFIILVQFHVSGV